MMKNCAVIVIILLSVSLPDARAKDVSGSSKNSDAIAYAITIDAGDHKFAHVRVSFVPKDSILYMDAGADQLPKRWATFVHDLKAVDARGKNININELPDAKWKLDLPDAKPITLSYKISLDHENYKWSGGIDGVAYGRDWGVFYSGRTLLILNGNEWRKIKVSFVLPKNWRITTPWQSLTPNSFLVKNLTELKRSMIFAGTHEEISIKRDKFELVFAIGGKELIAQKEEFKQLAEGVLDYYIALMGGIPNPARDNRFSRAIVIINPAESTDGEVIGNNISILIARNGDQMSRLFSRFIFAHEFFHLWSGKSFAPVADDTEWFKEGVTNYYTLKALHRVGFLTEATFLEALNTIFYKRYKEDNGVGKLSMSDGEQKHDHWGLIYAGGMFVGMQQDLSIRNATNNRKSLDDLMRRLFKKYGGTKDGYSLDELKINLSELNAADQNDLFQTYITGNKPLPITEIFAPAGLNARIEDGDLVISKRNDLDSLQKNIQKGFFGGK